MPHTVDLHFQQTGNGAPVVILHGLFGSARNWQTVARQLANEFTVITVDLRNHGSSPHAEQMDYTAMSTDLSALLRKLDLRDVNLIGHSMGGKTAMTLVLSEPDRIGRLIIVDIAPGPSDNEYDAMLDAMAGLDLSAVTGRADAALRLEGAIADRDIRLFILQNLRFKPGAPPTWRINLDAIRSGIGKLLDSVPCDRAARFEGPSYFIRGADSAHVGQRDLECIGQRFPGYRLITIPNSGHWPHVQNPSQFLAELRSLLADNRGSRVH